MITEEQYQQAKKSRDEAEEVIRDYIMQKREAFIERVKSNPIFKPEELKYAAFATCKTCGAGLAYPKECTDPHWHWDCSAILTGKVTGDEIMKHATYPFSMYEIKSEDQPSANGATTRPKEG